MTRTRCAELDTLRGLTLLSMIAYHACWDLVYLFHQNWQWYRSFAAYLWQQSICWTFILLSGYCLHLGRHRLRRGLMAFGAGALIWAVTALTMPDSRVFWGVLSLLGTATLASIPLDGLLRRLDARAGLAGSFLLFLLTRDVSRGALGFEGMQLLQLPRLLYRNDLTALLGFPPPHFFSTDYFPLLPWLFLFFTGYFLFLLRPEGADPSTLRAGALSALGQHSLLVYLLHQPVVFCALWLFFHFI